MKRSNLFTCLLMAAAVCGLTACSSSDDAVDNGVQNEKSQLTLTINAQGINGSNYAKGLTRAVATTAPSDEKTINRITVGIFDSNNNVRTIQELSSGSGDAGTGTFKTESGTTIMNIVTNKLDTGDKVLVAVNAPAGVFNGAQTVDVFKAKSIDADRAIATSSSEETKTQSNVVSGNAPMFGDATLSATGDGKTAYTASVDVMHLTAKISLTDLEVAFDPNGPYKDATFTPTEIYLDHVVDGLTFNPEAGHWMTPGKTLLSGLSTYADADKDKNTSNKSYLTTGEIDGENAVVLKGAENGENAKLKTSYYFYVTPSSNDTPSGNGSNATRVWIKGLFDPDGDGPTLAETVFYPVLLNVKYADDGTASAAEDNTDKYKVYPNRNYTCTVIIRTKGLAGSGTGGQSTPEPGSDSLSPQAATITVTVSDWNDVSQTTDFK